MENTEGTFNQKGTNNDEYNGRKNLLIIFNKVWWTEK